MSNQLGRHGRIFLLLIASVLLMLHNVPAASHLLAVLDFGTLGPDGLPQPWKLKERNGTALVRIVTEEGTPALYLSAVTASFSVEREVSVNLRDHPYLLWTWKALELPKQGDLRAKDRNDQALQVLVAFSNRKVLSYVWDSNAPEGTVSDESVGWAIFSLSVKVIVVKSGGADVGKWVTIQRNLYDDYRRVFNEEPSFVEGIRIQSNSQHTKGTGAGMVRSLAFGRLTSPGVEKATQQQGN